MLIADDFIRIPLRELHYTFARGSGPGGQNVNKVNSKVILTWNVRGSCSISEGVRERFLGAFANRINQDGFVVIASDRFRDQGRNVCDCNEKLVEMLRAVARPPKKRTATRPTLASRRERLDEKRQRGAVKRSRQKSSWE